MATVRSVRFDPRPARGRHAAMLDITVSDIVSIHAPARGRHAATITSLTFTKFRSTPPRGGDRGRTWMAIPDRGFDPRPRAGGDCFLLTHSFVWAQRRVRANPSLSGPALEVAWGIIRKCCRSSNGLRSGRKVRLFGSRFGFALAASAQPGGLQTISGPLKSAAGFAPTCSTRPRQFAPR